MTEVIQYSSPGYHCVMSFQQSGVHIGGILTCLMMSIYEHIMSYALSTGGGGGTRKKMEWKMESFFCHFWLQSVCCVVLNKDLMVCSSFCISLSLIVRVSEEELSPE